MKDVLNAALVNFERIPLSKYEEMDKSNVKGTRLVIPNIFDLNDFGSVEVTYKKPVWKT